MKTYIYYTLVLYCFVRWPMTVNSHYDEKNILKRISRSNNLQNANDSNSNSSISVISTIPIKNFESNDSTASSKPSFPNDGQASLTTRIPLQDNKSDNKSINEVDNFQNILPDQNYGNFVIIIFFSAMLILILGLLFIIIYKKQGNSFYQVRGIRRNHQETPA